MSPVRCGENAKAPEGVAGGCGKPIPFEVDVYRCTDCGTAFHRLCALRHFAEADAALVVVDWRASCIAAEERSDRMLALLRRMAAALRGRSSGPSDDTCGCLRCGALRAWEVFLKKYSDDGKAKELRAAGAA